MRSLLTPSRPLFSLTAFSAGFALFLFAAPTPATAQVLGTEDEQAVQAEKVLWSFVADPKTLVFREVNVLAVEKALREVATIRPVGGGFTYYDHVEYRIARYEIGERAYAVGVFFIELLLKAKDGDITNPEKLMVVNARVSFISKAGSCYENYLAPNDWPVAKIRDEQRAKTAPKASAEGAPHSRP